MDIEQQIRRARGQQLGDIPRRTAARVPSRTAIVFRGQSETFAELNTAINRAANGLAAQGITKGDRVIVLSHNNRDFVVLRFALARLGAITTPVNFMLNATDIAFILNHSGARMVLVEDTLCPVADAALTEAGKDLPKFAIPHSTGTTPAGWQPVSVLLDHPDDSDVWHDVDLDDPIQMMFTSGTESRPKGALQTSGALFSQYASCIADGEMREEAVSLHCLPLFHCAQLDCFLSPDIYLG